MNSLPKRTRSHVLDRKARDYVKQILPPEWIIQDGQEDYGIDLVVEIVKDEQVTGALFLMQLKGTDSLTVRKRGYVAHPCKTSTLMYFLQRPELIVYLVYDAQKNVGYWVWIKDYIRDKLKTNWKEQKTATVRIPLDNKFDADAVKEIARRVLNFHKQAKWLSAIETARNRYFRYGLEITDNYTKIEIYPRYPGAEKDRPVEISGTFKFDQTDPEAQAAFQALERHFKTGEPVEIDSRFFDGFDVPDAFSNVLAHEELGRTAKIMLSTARTDKRFVAKMSILDQEYRFLAEIPYIDFRVIQAGTEEVTLSNEEQDIPPTIRLRINSRDQTFSVSMGTDLVGKSVVQIRDILRIQQALARGTYIKLTNLETELCWQAKIPEGSISEPDEKWVNLINDLVFIQERTKELIRWPGQITITEAQLVQKVVNILQTGRSLEQVTGVHFEVDKLVARRLANAYSSGEQALRFDSPDYTIDLLNTKLSLGPFTAVLPNARPNDRTLQRFRELDQFPDDAIVTIDLDVGEPGVFFFYHQWLPQGSLPQLITKKRG